MSFNVAMLKQMREEGLDFDAAIRVLEAGETERSSAAVRQARYRDKKRNERDVTPPPIDNKSNPLSSEANASGCADPIKEMWDLGVAVLLAAGHSEREARSLIGKFNKTHSAGEVLTGLIECRARAIVNPVEWLTKRFKPAKYVSASGHEYRGSLEQIEREAQRRHDNDTYWQIQVDKKQDAAHA